jgi:inositol-pentakisphosphate 2-kinase
MAPTVEMLRLPQKDIAAFRELQMSQARCCIGTQDDIPDEARISLEYLHQGGANVVFKIHACQDQNDGKPSLLFVDLHNSASHAQPVHSSETSNKVLRVHKGLDKTLRSEEVIQGFIQDVRPLFQRGSIPVITNSTAHGNTSHTPAASTLILPDHDLTTYLMDHEPVVLFPDAMAALTSQSDTICQERGAEALTSVRWGILLPDMSPVLGSSVTLEIKPKWLVQSPTAPLNAIRCRTCALQILKPKDPKKYLCPLQLIHGDSDDIFQWAYNRFASKLGVEEVKRSSDVAKEEQENTTAAIATHVTAYLTKGPGSTVLKHLEFLQSKLDPQGALRRGETRPRDTFDHNLRLAMTLRDCSMYINIRYENVDALEVVCKLGDLDFKSADKMDDWAGKERELLASDAYTSVGVQNEPHCIYRKTRS